MEEKKLRTRFKSELLDEQLQRDGYVIIRNWADENQVSKMRQVFDDFYIAPSYSANLWNSLMINEEDKKIISNRLMEQLKPSIEKYLYDYKPPLNYFLAKPVDEDPTALELHSDSSAVNEEKYEYLIIWVPLVNVDKKNGCMYLIPGSHKLFTYEHPFGPEWPYPQLVKQLKKYALDLPLNAGDMLLFSPKTIHGSYPNRSKNPRPVVGSGLVHPATEMLFYYFDKDKNRVITYDVDMEFYLRADFQEPKEGKYTLKNSYDFKPPQITPEKVTQFFKENPVKYNGRFPFLRRLGLNL